MVKTSGTEQRGKCEGGKKPTSRSMKQVFQTYKKVWKTCTTGQKDFFDTLEKKLERWLKLLH